MDPLREVIDLQRRDKQTSAERLPVGKTKTRQPPLVIPPGEVSLNRACQGLENRSCSNALVLTRLNQLSNEVAHLQDEKILGNQGNIR